MLKIEGIVKEYTNGDLTQQALAGVSFNLRDNEFVAVLGQSGSGKTTLLNIIGGLDRYDTGDIIIDGISTKRYTDRDWDSYRNHTIGFVFQSYNLIPHQSILANVELSLTISGAGAGERRRKAKEALEKVGLGEHMHKRPTQMSGGQMQRVAIARALVNDPKILLADEPTGALDSETSVQVLDLLKEVAKDRLVVMVTHNPELASRYATRIIRLHDGMIVSDSNPFLPDGGEDAPPKHKNMGRASMSFRTALHLSFNNLRTKKGRTILTAFAGSIGIIGIALIMSLSNGVNKYIEDIQKETMSSYPISIDAQSFDLTSLITQGRESYSFNEEPEHDLDGVYSDSSGIEMASNAISSVKTNNLTAFKEYLDDPSSEIHEYIGSNGIVYSYDVEFDTYAYDPEGVLVNTDGSTFETDSPARMVNGMGMMSGMSSMPNMSSMNSFAGSGNFGELLPGTGDLLISDAVTGSYDVLYGSWPQAYDEVVLVLNEHNELPSNVLYELGLLPAEEYTDILERLSEGEKLEIEPRKIEYADVCGQVFELLPECDFYVQNALGNFDYVKDDEAAVEALMSGSVTLKIAGVVRASESSSYDLISAHVGYTGALTSYIIEHTNGSPVVAAQEASPNKSVLNGMFFSPVDDEQRIEDAIEYLSNMGTSEKAAFFQEMTRYMEMGGQSMSEQMENLGEPELAAMLDQYLQNPDETVLLTIYNTYITAGSFDDNMEAFGVVSLDAPSSISLYSDSFEGKDSISASIDAYNVTAAEADQIVYTDYVGLLMSSVTTIINVISYVLIAFVAVSLVVSSIMIGIITFISVLERTKEIGILRAIGASKRNISQVFNAETFIIGLFAGLIGIGVSLLLLVPGNAIIHAVADTTDVNASLPVVSAALLVVLSMGLTLIAGIIPSRKAARKDAVVALRSE